MKKTLLICGLYPLPETVGANMRTMHFVRFFQQYGPVDIAYDRVLKGEKAGSSVFAREYKLTKIAESLPVRFFRLSFTDHRPFEVSRLHEESERLLLATIQANDYDFICARYMFDTWCLFKAPEKYRRRTLIDYDDILSDSSAGLGIATARGIKKHIYKINQRVMRRYEERCLNFGAALFCSEKDRSRVAGAAGRANTFVVPNIYDNSKVSSYNFGDGFENDHTLLFVGALNYQPNIQGLKWFVETIFPSFVSRFPGARLHVVGRSPHPEVVKSCTERPDIELHENAPDIRKYYKNCRAVIVPLLAGGGTRIKILEAAMAGRPVLSTPKGAEGLALRDDKELLLFGSHLEFVGQYEKLLEKEKYVAIAHSAKAVVATNYSVSGFNEVMERVVERIEEVS